MDVHLLDTIDSFVRLRVLVVGDAMLDVYLRGEADRISREAPVPIVALSAREQSPGGAANAAVNLSRLGASVALLSVIGQDAEGAALLQCLAQADVDVQEIMVMPQRQTLAKNRVIAGAQTLVRYDQGSTSALDEAAEHALIARLVALYDSFDAIVVSDYGYGVLTAQVIAVLRDLQTENPRTLVVDSKRLPAYRDVGVTAVKPNYAEAARLLGSYDLDTSGGRAAALEAHNAALIDITGAQIVAVTLDVDGALIFERGSTPYRTYARPTAHTRAIGAGDTYISALTLALAAGAETTAAAEIAAAAAAHVVGQEGTAACTLGDLRTLLSAGAKVIDDRSHIAALVEGYKQQGRRVVFTNGCFDILHRGHVTYLSQAKALGDVLIVGVNADNSIRRLKGPTRPINGLDDRLHVLAALSCIDHVIAFAEDTPVELIRAVRPNVFVKGGDYTRQQLPEAPVVEAMGGEIHLLPFLPDRSTTRIIERIGDIERAVGQ